MADQFRIRNNILEQSIDDGTTFQGTGLNIVEFIRASYSAGEIRRFDSITDRDAFFARSPRALRNRAEGSTFCIVNNDSMHFWLGADSPAGYNPTADSWKILLLTEGATGGLIATNITIGTVTEGEAEATITGTPPNLVLNLVIPQGPQGPGGPQGPPGEANDGVGIQAITLTQDEDEVTLDFTKTDGTSTPLTFTLPESMGGGETPVTPHPTHLYYAGRGAAIPTTETGVEAGTISGSLPLGMGQKIVSFPTGNNADIDWLAFPTNRYPTDIVNADFVAENILDEVQTSVVGQYTILYLDRLLADTDQRWRVTFPATPVITKRTYGQALLDGTAFASNERLNVPNEVCVDADSILVAQGDANLYDYNIETGARSVQSNVGSSIRDIGCDDNYIYIVDRIGGGGGNNNRLRALNKTNYEQMGNTINFDGSEQLYVRDGVVYGLMAIPLRIYVTLGTPDNNLRRTVHNLAIPSSWHLNVGHTIAVSPSGKVYVATRDISSPFEAGILVYDSVSSAMGGTQPTATIAGNGVGTGNNQFGNGLLKNTIAFHGEFVYVLDGGNDRIQVFNDSDQAYVRTISFSDLAVGGEEANTTKFNRINIVGDVLYLTGNRTSTTNTNAIANSGFIRRIEGLL